MPDHSDAAELLTALQRADSTILKLTKLIDDLPEQREIVSIDARLDVIANTIADITVEQQDVKARLAREERELELFSTRLGAESQRLYDGSVTNPREIQAVEAEIAQTTRRIADHEDQLLAVMEEHDEIGAKLAALADEQSTLTTRRDELEAQLVVSSANYLAERDDAQSVRNNLFVQLPDDLKQRYTTVAARSGGVGAAELIDGSCSACRIALSHVDLDGLLNGPPIAECPSCRRILVVPPWVP